MKKLLKDWPVLVLLLAPSAVFAQQPTEPTINTIANGRVLDSKTGSPLDGATVQIKGTTNAATTDSKGNFTLRTGQKLPYTLIVSFVGYQSLETVATTPDIEVKLQTADGNLNEVVVVGYGVQKKSDLTGSVASVSPNLIKQSPVSSFDRILQGAVAGVQVIQTSDNQAAQ